MNLRPTQRQAPEVNLTPLIDVVFLLLIFFMVSTSFEHDSKIKVQLPEASPDAAETAQTPNALRITIDKEGRFFVNQKAVSDTHIDTLIQAIIDASNIHDEEKSPVVISADARTPYQALVTAMDAASGLGHNQISFPIKQSASD